MLLAVAVDVISELGLCTDEVCSGATLLDVLGFSALREAPEVEVV